MVEKRLFFSIAVLLFYSNLMLTRERISQGQDTEVSTGLRDVSETPPGDYRSLQRVVVVRNMLDFSGH